MAIRPASLVLALAAILPLLALGCPRGGDPAAPSNPPAAVDVGAPRAADISRPAPVALSSTPPAPPVAETLDERAARVHREAIVVDGHDDIPTVIAQTGFDLGKPNGRTSTDLPKMKAGGITAEFFSIYVDADYVKEPPRAGGGAARRALDLIDLTYRQVERYPGDLVLARTVDDVRRAKAEGKVAVMMGIEGGHAIEDSLSALRDFYRLGVRYMTLTHVNTNDWADSAGFSGPVPVEHHGLTAFGEDVVREMQRIGMLVDVSHVSDETFFAVMRVARAPVIASHSSARAVADHRRNLTDDMLRALAQGGGVCMVNFWPAFIDPAFMAHRKRFFAAHKAELAVLLARDAHDELKLGEDIAALEAASDPPPVTPISVLVDHIDHIVKVAGIDHVGLGSDFDGVDALPAGLKGLDGLPRLTRALLERGYSEVDVKKILGENFLRALSAAEAYARSTGTSLSGDGSLKTVGP